MRKVYKKLTQDQIARDVIFSSELLPADGRRHEVFANDSDKDRVIKNLLNDSFFNHSHYKVNEVRQ